MIRGLLLKNGKLLETSLDGKLESYYERLDCEIIDIVSRDIGGERFAVVCDDCGVYAENSPISMIDRDLLIPMLVGALFICNLNGDELDSLSDDDIRLIRSQFKHQVIYGDI